MAVVDVRAVYGTTIKQYFIGASTDTKPTDVPVGAKFLESDTNTTYIFGSDKSWYIDPEHQSLNKVWDSDALEWVRQTQPLVNISNSSFYMELGSMDIQFNSINTKLNSIEIDFDPTAKYNIAYGDTVSATSYYCFQARGGSYYVLRISNGSYLYYRNSATMDTGWAGRNTLSFSSFAEWF